VVDTGLMRRIGESPGLGAEDADPAERGPAQGRIAAAVPGVDGEDDRGGHRATSRPANVDVLKIGDEAFPFAAAQAAAGDGAGVLHDVISKFDEVGGVS
jgi:hypothetical protein